MPELEANGVSNKVVRATFWEKSVDVEMEVEPSQPIEEEDEFQSLYMGSSDLPKAEKVFL